MLSRGFSTVAQIVILGQIILCCGGCPVHCRRVSSSLGLSLLNASHTPSPNCDNPKYLQTLPRVPWGA